MSSIELPPHWPIKPLEAVVDILDRHRVPVSAKERAKRPGDIPYYGATGQVDTIDDKLFDEPLVLLGEDGVAFLDPLAPKAYLIDGPSWVNNHAHVLRAQGSLDRRFLMHWLNLVDYRGYVNGTTRLKLTQGSMRALPTPVPPLDEQRAVVQTVERALSRLDAARASASTARARSIKLRSSAVEMLLREAHSDGEAAPLPELWRSARYGTSERCEEKGPGLPVLRIPNVRWRELDLNDIKRVADPEADVSSALVETGDVLIIRTNGSRSLIGRTAAVSATPERMACASYLIRLRLDTGAVIPSFVAAALEAPSTRARLEALAGSSAGQYNLSVAKLKRISLPVPSLATQQRLVSELESREKALQHLEAAVDLTEQRSTVLRRSIVEATFKGQLTGTTRRPQSVEGLAEAIA